MSNIIEGLAHAIADALDDDGDEWRGARAAIAYLASCEAVEAGPEVPDSVPLPWITGWNGPISDATRGAIFVDNDDGAAAAVYRVNHWDALRAQLVATRAQLDDALVRNMREQDEHSAERAKLARERDAALARVAELEACK